MTGLDDQAEVRRKGTTVTSPGSLLIGVWRRKVVGQLSWALEHLAFIIWAVRVLNVLSEYTRLISSMRHANQVTPGNAVE
jgi:hypothetical protein